MRSEVSYYRRQIVSGFRAQIVGVELGEPSWHWRRSARPFDRSQQGADLVFIHEYIMPLDLQAIARLRLIQTTLSCRFSSL
jgi:hypothetical protein